jgi:hypothetical protein
MTTQPNDGLLYLNDYPRLRKWINQCVICQCMGSKPDIPADANGRANLLRYFPVVCLNERGLCDQCAATGEQKTGSA